MSDGQPVPGSLFIYAPNKGAPVFFAVAFAISAVGHIWQASRYKAFRLIGLHPLCAVLFAAGYSLREYGAFNFVYDENDEASLLVFVLSQVLIYICPPLLELANYHVLGRILYYVPYLAPLPPGRVLATFGALMAAVEALNAIGVALVANPSSAESTQETGSSLTIAAISLQLVVIAIFVCLGAIFHRRCIAASLCPRAVSTPLAVLYGSMALILVRCIYRLVEHIGFTSVDLGDPESLNNLSPLLRYEWFFYVFEGTLMLLNSVLWNVWHPGRYLPHSHGVCLSRDGTEVETEQARDDRQLLAKVGHILSFGLLFRRKMSLGTYDELHEVRLADNLGSDGARLARTTST